MDQYTFRQLCGRFATGVVIVTARGNDGLPCGMTVNSFVSISLEPPLIAIAISHDAAILPDLLGGTRFTINILESGQESLSRRFASGVTDRFDGVGWEAGTQGEILLNGVLAHLRCEYHTASTAGDHTIIIGRVIGGNAAPHGRPLLFYRGGYSDFESI